MFANIDHSKREVQAEFRHWAAWLSGQVKVGGLRLDAIKHYSSTFQRDFITALERNGVGRDWLYVGEYWDTDAELLAAQIDFHGGRLSLFDVPLVHSLSRVSMQDGADLRTVFDDALCLLRPTNAVVRTPRWKWSPVFCF